METRDTGLGFHVADLPTETMKSGGKLHFTFRWPRSNNWEGRDFELTVDSPTQGPSQSHKVGRSTHSQRLSAVENQG
jgi:hypothetical protein